MQNIPDFPRLTALKQLFSGMNLAEEESRALTEPLHELLNQMGLEELQRDVTSAHENNRLFSELEPVTVRLQENMEEAVSQITSQQVAHLKLLGRISSKLLRPETLALFTILAMQDLFEHNIQAASQSYLASQMMLLFQKIVAQNPSKGQALCQRLFQARKELEEQNLKCLSIRAVFEELEEESRETEWCKKLLSAIADMAELRYQTYARILDDLFVLAGHCAPVTSRQQSFGNVAERVDVAMENNYPEFAYLFDKDFVKIRNAVAHRGVRLVKSRPPTYELKNRNDQGKEWTLTLDFSGISARWEQIDETVGSEGYVILAVVAFTAQKGLQLLPKIRTEMTRELSEGWPALKDLLEGTPQSDEG